jgi:hypothetical protein
MAAFVPTLLPVALAPARVAQAEQPWGSIRRDGLPARLGAHWEGGLQALSSLRYETLESCLKSFIIVDHHFQLQC